MTSHRFKFTRLLAGDNHPFQDYQVARRFEISQFGALVFYNQAGLAIAAFNNWVSVEED